MDVSRWSGLITSCREIQPAQYSTVQYSTVQYSTVQASTGQHLTFVTLLPLTPHPLCHTTGQRQRVEDFHFLASFQTIFEAVSVTSFCLWLVVGEVLPGPGVWVAVPCVGGTLIIIPLMLFLPGHEVMGHCYTRNHSSAFTIIIGSK